MQPHVHTQTHTISEIRVAIYCLDRDCISFFLYYQIILTAVGAVVYIVYT